MSRYRPTTAPHEHRRRSSRLATTRDSIPLSAAAARTPSPSPTQRAKDMLRAVAEHEAAHVIVAQHYGCTINHVAINPNGHGHTSHTRAVNDFLNGVIIAAGDVWQRTYGTVPYVDLAREDLADFEAERGLRHYQRAAQAAQRILQQHRLSVRALADQLIDDHHNGEPTPAAAPKTTPKRFTKPSSQPSRTRQPLKKQNPQPDTTLRMRGVPATFTIY
ncbi:hypothetical protein [Streptomyces sp. NPDC085479]|uniref:hypothetical protein n=1 Tax=Streptomyces sp. NPDC085479 TaxID=3365726 RepID=UPI0037D8F134